MKDVIEQTIEAIKELSRLSDSDDIIKINQVCNDLSTLSVNIGKQVSDAQDLFSELEDEFNNSTEAIQLELIEGGEGVGKAKIMANVKTYDKKGDWRKAKNGHDRLKRFLGRIDKVLDTYKQYTATVKKANLKNI